MQFLIGFLVGAVVVGVAIWKIMPGMMSMTKKSNMNFEDTVEAVQNEAKALGWNAPHVYNMQQSFTKAGYDNVEKMKVISLGHAKFAYQIVRNDKDKNILGFMPYRAGVYEDKNGDVYITGANMGIMSKIFGGNVEKIMGASAKELERAFSKFTK
ncbi:MAG: DUF302 domain-containing protein [Sulfurospirillum sp.]